MILIHIKTTGLAVSQIESLLAVMEKLRDPETGCPWDLEQTYESIVPHTIEEVYEVVDAIEKGDITHLREELGDLLFQVVFYAQLGKENSDFDFDDIVVGIRDKLVRRHPHVFDIEYSHHREGKMTVVQQSEAWEALKQKEKKARNNDNQNSVMDDIPLSFPALTRAKKIQNNAANVGFDWDDIAPVWDKLQEEADEIREAINENMGQDKIEDEVGDLLCVCVNLARHLKVDPEKAMRRSNNKFERRFRYIETTLAKSGISIEDATLEQMDSLWDEAKRQE